MTQLPSRTGVTVTAFATAKYSHRSYADNVNQQHLLPRSNLPLSSSMAPSKSATNSKKSSRKSSMAVYKFCREERNSHGLKTHEKSCEGKQARLREGSGALHELLAERIALGEATHFACWAILYNLFRQLPSYEWRCQSTTRIQRRKFSGRRFGPRYVEWFSPCATSKLLLFWPLRIVRTVSTRSLDPSNWGRPSSSFGWLGAGLRWV